MSDSHDSDSPADFPSAAAVISAFGGIRPMAARLDVPVSTVQGWKQRDAIPENRFEQIREVARADGIDLDGLPPGEAPDGDDTDSGVEIGQQAETASEGSAGDEATESADKPEPSSAPEPAAPMTPGNPAAPARSSGGAALPIAIVALIVAVAVAAGGWLVWTQQQSGTGTEDLRDQVSALESKVAKLAAAGPAATPQEIDALSGRLDELARKLDSVAANSADESRIAALSTGVADVRTTVGDLQKSLSSNAAEMSSLRTGVDNTMTDLSARLVALENRDSSAAAREARAVGLAIAANEIRRTLRSGAPFANELATVRQLAGSDADLTQAVDTLAASAADGLPSTATLSRRFDARIGAILSASRIDEGAPWYRQALNRVADVVSIRRIGAESSGDSVDAVVARAEAKLADGDLAGAVAEVEALQGAPAEAVSAWLADARKVVAAEAAVAQINSKALATLAASRSQ